MTQIQKNTLAKSKILLVEDDENLRENLKKILLLWAGRVLEASNGKDGLEIYHKAKPDIIITDIKMPKLSGIELAKQVRKNNAQIPIIIISAFSDKDYLFQAIKLHLIDYLIKPVGGEDLEKVLGACADAIKQKDKVIEIKNSIKYDYENKVILTPGGQIRLTNKEVELLELLLEHRGNLLTKQKIEDKLYIYKEMPGSALKNLIFKLRKKLGVDLIKSVDKLGYKIECFSSSSFPPPPPSATD